MTHNTCMNELALDMEEASLRALEKESQRKRRWKHIKDRCEQEQLDLPYPILAFAVSFFGGSTPPPPPPPTQPVTKNLSSKHSRSSMNATGLAAGNSHELKSSKSNSSITSNNKPFSTATTPRLQHHSKSEASPAATNDDQYYANNKDCNKLALVMREWGWGWKQRACDRLVWMAVQLGDPDALWMLGAAPTITTTSTPASIKTRNSRSFKDAMVNVEEEELEQQQEEFEHPSNLPMGGDADMCFHLGMALVKFGWPGLAETWFSHASGALGHEPSRTELAKLEYLDGWKGSPRRESMFLCSS